MTRENDEQTAIFSVGFQTHENHPKPTVFIAFPFIQDGREAPLPRRCSTLFSARWYRSGFLNVFRSSK